MQLCAMTTLGVAYPGIWNEGIQLLPHQKGKMCVQRCRLVETAFLGTSPRLVPISGLLYLIFHWFIPGNWHENIVDLEDLVALEFQFPLFNDVAQLWGEISY